MSALIYLCTVTRHCVQPSTLCANSEHPSRVKCVPRVQSEPSCVSDTCVQKACWSWWRIVSLLKLQDLVSFPTFKMGNRKQRLGLCRRSPGLSTSGAAAMTSHQVAVGRSQSHQTLASLGGWNIKSTFLSIGKITETVLVTT